MRIFIKYFLLFNPTFLVSFIGSYISGGTIRTDNVPWSFLYIKPNYRLFLFCLSFLFPLSFYIQGYLNYGHSMLLFKYTIVFFTFISGLFIVSSYNVLLEIKKAAKIFFWLSILLATIQYSNLLLPFDDLLKYFFSERSSFGKGSSYRGVALFYTEVSRAGFYVMLLYVIAYGFKIKKSDLFAFTVLGIYIVLLNSSLTSIIVLGLYGILNFPLKGSILIILFYLGLIIFNILENEIISFNHYKVDEFVKAFINQNISIFDIVIGFEGGRVSGVLNSIIIIILNPFGYFYVPKFFEPVSGFIPVSGPLLFLRTFGIFAILYFYLFLKQLGKGSIGGVIGILILSCLYCPNGTALLLMALVIEYKFNNKESNENKI